MLAIPSELQSKQETHLQRKEIPHHLKGMHKKRLLYYLDFCRKYHLPPKNKKSLPPFIRKLQEKQQSRSQREQVVSAVSLYYEFLPDKMSILSQKSISQSAAPSAHALLNDKTQTGIKPGFFHTAVLNGNLKVSATSCCGPGQCRGDLQVSIDHGRL